jgi:oligo-1,6-glucosidase
MTTRASTSFWWKQTPIYHIYPRSFRDTNGDGIGDLPGIVEKLPYLADMGIGAIWMGPIFRSPQVDNGYDISDYRDVDPMFGTLEDLDRLISAAHDAGIRVLLDLVFNHSSNQHRWFTESVRDPAGPYGDYYIWRDAVPPPGDRADEQSELGATPDPEGRARSQTSAPLPNNWQSFFTGPTWTWSPERGQYYLHLFAPEQPDLNWDNPAVRRELADIANYWLDRGVDGFRMDVINFIAKVEGLPSIARETDARIRDAAALDAAAPDARGPGAYIDHGRMVGYLREFRSRLHRADEIVLVGETPHISNEWARELTHSDSGPLDMVLLFEHLEVDHGPQGRWDPATWSTELLSGVLDRQQRALAGSSWPSLYMGNHDQPRIVSRYGDDQEFRFASATALATLFYLQRGTPIIYQGDEIAMANYPLENAASIVDIESGNAYRALVQSGAVSPHEALRRVARNARDNGRTPMQWDGIQDDTWWYPLNPDHRQWNVESQRRLPEHQSVLKYYRRLLSLRAAHPALTEGTFQLLTGESPCIAFCRTAGAEEVIVVANLSSRNAPFPREVANHLADGTAVRFLMRNVEAGEIGAGERAIPEEAAQACTRDDLLPWEARVLLRSTAV